MVVIRAVGRAWLRFLSVSATAIEYKKRPSLATAVKKRLDRLARKRVRGRDEIRSPLGQFSDDFGCRLQNERVESYGGGAVPGSRRRLDVGPRTRSGRRRLQRHI